MLKLWVEGVAVGYPGKKNEESASSKLTPRECRERGLTYQGALLVDLCYQVRYTATGNSTGSGYAGRRTSLNSIAPRLAHAHAYVRSVSARFLWFESN